jgi:hypothetical protein
MAHLDVPPSRPGERSGENDQAPIAGDGMVG